MEQGWNEREKRAGGSFLRLKAAGDKAAVTLLAPPVQFRQHFDRSTNTATICTKRETGACVICDDYNLDKDERYASDRFGISVYVHSTKDEGAQAAQTVNEVQTFEQSGRTFDTLKANVDELGDDWNKRQLTIKRTGIGKDTMYLVVTGSKNVPLPADLEIPDLAAFYMQQITGGAPDQTEAPSAGALADVRKPKAANAAADSDDVDFGDPFADE